MKNNDNKRVTHQLKIHPKYYAAVKSGIKTFEIRKNDRNFKVGDEIELSEYADGHFTHAPKIYGIITYITDYEQKDNNVVLAIRWSLDENY